MRYSIQNPAYPVYPCSMPFSSLARTPLAMRLNDQVYEPTGCHPWALNAATFFDPEFNQRSIFHPSAFMYPTKISSKLAERNST